MSENAPPRGPLPPDVARAARTIHAAVWHQLYVPGKGPMHHATGPYWRQELRRLAELWEKRAAAARVCAEFLSAEGDPR